MGRDELRILLLCHHLPLFCPLIYFNFVERDCQILHTTIISCSFKVFAWVFSLVLYFISIFYTLLLCLSTQIINVIMSVLLNLQYFPNCQQNTAKFFGMAFKVFLNLLLILPSQYFPHWSLLTL